MTASRSVHLRPRSLGLVFVGGAVGTAARAAVVAAIPAPGGVPLAVLGVNVVGAFVLGLLLGWLQRSGSDDGPRRDLRLLLGTGVLGGFTTYSTLAIDTVGLLDRPGIAILYALGTLALGLSAAIAGLRCGGGRTG